MKRIGAILLAGMAGLVGCSDHPNVVLTVAAPPAGDKGCIGVAGFVIDVSAASTSTHTSLRATPVLSEAQCRLDHPLSLSDLDARTAMSVSLYGYDSGGNALVNGQTNLGTLEQPRSEALQLTDALSPLRPILLLQRSTFLAATPLTDVTQMQVRTVPQGTVLLSVTVDDFVRPFFLAHDPGTFQVGVPSLTDAQEVDLTFATSSSGTITSNGRSKWALHVGADYTELVPLTKPNGK
jgi:hypothetical protein